MSNRNLLIGAGIIVVGYLFWKQSQRKANFQRRVKLQQYPKECYDELKRRLEYEDVKPINFEKDFLENCSKLRENVYQPLKNKI